MGFLGDRDPCLVWWINLLEMCLFSIIASVAQRWSGGTNRHHPLAFKLQHPGFYQCVGLVAGRPETAITGDVSVTGNTGTITYLLNTSKYKYMCTYHIYTL